MEGGPTPRLHDLSRSRNLRPTVVDQGAIASVSDDESVDVGDGKVVHGLVLKPAFIVEVLDDAEFAGGAFEEVADGEVVGVGPPLVFDPDGVVGRGGPGVGAGVVVGDLPLVERAGGC